MKSMEVIFQSCEVGGGRLSDWYVFSKIIYYILGLLFTIFLWMIAYMYDLKSLAERMLLYPGKNAAREKAN